MTEFHPLRFIKRDSCVWVISVALVSLKTMMSAGEAARTSLRLWSVVGLLTIKTNSSRKVPLRGPGFEASPILIPLRGKGLVALVENEVKMS